MGGKGIKRLFQRGGDNNNSNSPPMIRKSPRQLYWAGLFLSTLIALGSTFEAVRMQRYFSPPNSTQSWAVGSITFAFLLTFLCITLQLVPVTSPYLQGTKLELLLIFIVAAFTCAAVGSATNPASGMAVNASGGVSFGNLYYSTWGSFGFGVALLMSFMRTERGLDVEAELVMRGRRFRLWVILIITNLIVMGSSSMSYDAKCGVGVEEQFRPTTFCRRAAFGVSAGCIGCVVSLAVVAMRLQCTKLDNPGKSNKIIFVVECIASGILFCFYCFAVAYLTSEKGPGAPLGNLFYSTWITFGLTLFVAISCYEELQAAKKVYTQNQHGGDASEGELSSLRSGPADWGANDQNNLPVEPIIRQPPPVDNGFNQVPQPSPRSGSVGEVQIEVGH